MQELLLIRADANAVIGVGHVMRCLGLAQQWLAEGGRAIFILGEPNEIIQKKLAQELIESVVINQKSGTSEDAKETANQINKLKAKIILVDGYQFDAAWLQIIKKQQAKLVLWVDYIQQGGEFADLIINQNFHAQEPDYQKICPQGRILAGLKYLVLRKEFFSNPAYRRKRNQGVKKILISIGGGDHANDTVKIIDTVGAWAVNKCEITVIVGYNNPNREAIELSAQKFKSIKILPAQENFAQFSIEFDLVITAGGATVWESAYLGLPTLALVVAQNQVPLAVAVQDLGIGVNLGWNKDLAPSVIIEKLQNLINQPVMLESMSVRALDLIDGRGVIRVTQEIEQLLK